VQQSNDTCVTRNEKECHSVPGSFHLRDSDRDLGHHFSPAYHLLPLLEGSVEVRAQPLGLRRIRVNHVDLESSFITHLVQLPVC
jgi:hypothetical protein